MSKLSMFKPWLLRLHRWTTLTFALPLAALVLTGLILSFEPIVAGKTSGHLAAETLGAILAKHDPDEKARALIVRSQAGNVSIRDPETNRMIHVDLASNEKIASPGALANFFTTSRRLHETFLLDLRWLVSLSTAAMLVLIAIGVLMGWPRLSNSLSGWHKGVGWFVLPLLIISPLTGLFIAFGITFASPPGNPTAKTAPVSLQEAVRVVGDAHDLANVVWIRPFGNTLRARINDGGEMRVFTVSGDGLTATSRNWPRLIHEGNWAGGLSALINVVTSAALVALLSTGLLLWARRKFRRRKPRMRAAPPA